MTKESKSYYFFYHIYTNPKHRQKSPNEANISNCSFKYHLAKIPIYSLSCRKATCPVPHLLVLPIYPPEMVS